MQVREKTDADQPWADRLLASRWGAGGRVVLRGAVYDARALPGLIAGELAGLATYVEHGQTAELVTLDAVTPRQGAGTALVEALCSRLAVAGCTRLRVVTTNDNVDALRFYQRRGFRLVGLRPGAVDEARKRKPQIPETGLHGIPLRDELELERTL